MAVVSRRLPILLLIALYFVSAFCGQGLHSVVCEHGVICDHGACDGDICCNHSDASNHSQAHHHGHASAASGGWHAAGVQPNHDADHCAVCQFLAKAQWTAEVDQFVAIRLALPALPAIAPAAPALRVAVAYSPRGPPGFSVEA